MFDREVVLTVAEQAELQFGLLVVDRRFDAVAVGRLFVQWVLGL